MAVSSTSFKKLRCSKCGERFKNCFCFADVSDNETITLPGGRVEKINDIRREYIARQIALGNAEAEGRYIPRVEIAKPEIEHDSCSAKKAGRKRLTLTGKNGKLGIVHRKSVREAKGPSKGRRIFKGGI